MEKENLYPQLSPEQLYTRTYDLTKEYKAALLQLPSFQQACTELVMSGEDKNEVKCTESKTSISVRASNIQLSSSIGEVFEIETIKDNVYTTVILSLSKSNSNGEAKQGNVDFHSITRKDIVEEKINEVNASGTDAINLACDHVQELYWLGIKHLDSGKVSTQAAAGQE